jgi:predicted Zn-dependent protease
MIPQAIEAFQQAAAADPDTPRYPLCLASLYASQGRASEAQAALQAAQRTRRKPP